MFYCLLKMALLSRVVHDFGAHSLLSRYLFFVGRSFFRFHSFPLHNTLKHRNIYARTVWKEKCFMYFHLEITLFSMIMFHLLPTTTNLTKDIFVFLTNDKRKLLRRQTFYSVFHALREVFFFVLDSYILKIHQATNVLRSE